MAAKIEAGKAYRLRRDFEIRNEHGTVVKTILKHDQVVQVKKVDAEVDHVWVEGVSLVIPLAAFQNAVVEA